jgi:hypothetical protein
MFYESDSNYPLIIRLQLKKRVSFKSAQKISKPISAGSIALLLRSNILERILL